MLDFRALSGESQILVYANALCQLVNVRRLPQFLDLPTTLPLVQQLWWTVAPWPRSPQCHVCAILHVDPHRHLWCNVASRHEVNEIKQIPHHCPIGPAMPTPSKQMRSLTSILQLH
eukprot:GGOE01026706.1.p2 GENE.GGOE01026706.1~~GGOE01026706.1.p2  ORF type:complete len:116 (+),score=5.15 GGOE01026706.1:510-857(+)